MSKRAYKTYSKEFKVEAVRLAAESDRPVTQVARELGLRVNQIYKWRKGIDKLNAQILTYAIQCRQRKNQDLILPLAWLQFIVGKALTWIFKSARLSSKSKLDQYRANRLNRRSSS